MTAHADHIRGLAVHSLNEDAEPKIIEVELCPGARVYSYTLCGEFAGDPPEPPELVATLRLQDSKLELWSDCCELRADLPGLAWPSFAKLIVEPGARVTLNVTYGNCA